MSTCSGNDVICGRIQKYIFTRIWLSQGIYFTYNFIRFLHRCIFKQHRIHCCTCWRSEIIYGFAKNVSIRLSRNFSSTLSYLTVLFNIWLIYIVLEISRMSIVQRTSFECSLVHSRNQTSQL